MRERISPLIVLIGPYYNWDFLGHGEKWGKADLATVLSFNEAVAGVATAEACLYVDVLRASGEADWLVHYDGVHANDLGHRVIANAIFNVLAQSCSGLSLRTKEAERTSPRWRDESVLKADYGH